jgi:hypothetical protein
MPKHQNVFVARKLVSETVWKILLLDVRDTVVKIEVPMTTDRSEPVYKVCHPVFATNLQQNSTVPFLNIRCYHDTNQRTKPTVKKNKYLNESLMHRRATIYLP